MDSGAPVLGTTPPRQVENPGDFDMNRNKDEAEKETSTSDDIWKNKEIIYVGQNEVSRLSPHRKTILEIPHTHRRTTWFSLG